MSTSYSLTDKNILLKKLIKISKLLGWTSRL